MPDQSSAANEHALLQEITAPLATLPDDAVQVAANPEFPIAFRGYDRLAVDAYVKKTSQLVAELQSTRSPEAAVRRALERVGEQIAGILKRAHETAEQITGQSRREAEARLQMARQEAIQVAATGEQRVKDLDADTDRIWAERLRIVEDARELAAQLLALADAAAERFPPAEETPGEARVERPAAAVYDAEEDQTKTAAPVTKQPSEEPEAAEPEEPEAAEPEEPEAAELEEPEAAPPEERAPGDAPGYAEGEHEAPPQPERESHEHDDSEQTRVMPPVRPGQNAPPAGPASEPAPPPEDAPPPV